MGEENVNTTPNFSEQLSGTCKMFDNAINDYKWNISERNRMEGLIQDYLHQLELEDLNDEQLLDIAKNIVACRRQRRAHKDTIEILEPMVRYFDTDNGKRLVNLMKEVLGQTRKLEDRMSNRVYVCRVLGTEE